MVQASIDSNLGKLFCNLDEKRKIMVSQPIWIAVVIVVFFIGIGASYAHFANTYDPMSMKIHNQELFDQMMSHNPKMSQQWMDSDMMNAIMNDPDM